MNGLADQFVFLPVIGADDSIVTLGLKCDIFD